MTKPLATDISLTRGLHHYWRRVKWYVTHSDTAPTDCWTIKTSYRAIDGVKLPFF